MDIIDILIHKIFTLYNLYWVTTSERNDIHSKFAMMICDLRHLKRLDFVTDKLEIIKKLTSLDIQGIARISPAMCSEIKSHTKEMITEIRKITCNLVVSTNSMKTN